jgi:NAD(P)-dependent dehydrogenase (short-subunit alcohol dehydrogenase family)
MTHSSTQPDLLRSEQTMAGQTAVIVTGAAGRLGSAIVHALAGRDAQLLLTDANSASLEQIRGQTNDQAVTLPADIRDTRQAEALVRHAIEAFGRVDAVVNAAGIEGPIVPLEEVTTEAFAEVYETNVVGPFQLLRAVLPHLKEQQHGRIVNIASGAGLAGVEYMAPYSSSKHALVGLTRSLAREVARHGVSVNAVCPGCVDSPMMARIERQLQAIVGGDASFAGSIPAGRYADPNEVAGLVEYLIFDAPSYLTGEALVIDGGLRA